MNAVLRYDGQSYTTQGTGRALTQEYATRVLAFNAERQDVHPARPR